MDGDVPILQLLRGLRNREMYAIKQIKICAEYRNMLTRPRMVLLGTPGLSFWQTILGLGSMPRYSAQISICVTVF